MLMRILGGRAWRVRPAPDLRGAPRTGFAVLVLTLILAIAAPLFFDTIAHDAPSPVAGSVSYGRWGALSAPVQLGGSWRLTWRGGDDGVVPAGTTAIAPVPGSWRGIAVAGGRRLPAHGVASYALTLHDVPSGRYILYVPASFAADRVFIGGRPIDTSGHIGTDRATTRYHVRSHELAIEADGGPIVLRIDIASFLDRESGLGGVPVLGLAGPMRTWIARAWIKDLLIQSALMLLAMNALVAFFFRRQDRPSLYLAIAALCAMPAAAILGYDNLLLLALPGLGFGGMLAFQYLATTLAMGFFLVYARTLFPHETPRPFHPILALLAVYLVVQAVVLARGDTLTASYVALAWPLLTTITLLFITFIVARAAIRRRTGAVVFLLGIGVFAWFTIMAMIGWSGLVPLVDLPGANMFGLGMLMLLFSHVVVAAERSSLATFTAEQINEDLRELIEVNAAITSEVQLNVLLARIIEVTSRILNADRSTLLLHDERSGELWSLVAEGLETREIRMPGDAGLAGYAFQHRETVNVPQAYADPRFNRQIDLATSYRTTSILTMPVITRDGRRLGVMQALNRRDGRPFSEDDETRMIAFAAQAAIAIDNATLFDEVVTSRNYNESILRSMSSGVVTLDRDAGIAKLNAAATRILNLPAEMLEGVSASALLARTNPWLLSEIDAVASTGESKSLIDVDLVAGGGKLVSTNITIVPLLGDHGPAGLLVLIEDITEGKRLQGAMRRFMTQKVVDQVLERGDDLLFGTACEASVLFADIRNFTAMAEVLTPRETVDMLNEAFTELFDAVAAHDGVLDKFIGDAVMAVYGAPLTTGRDPVNAVASAVQMLRAVRELNERRGARSQPPLRLGVGITTGEVVAGTIGSPKRMDYTVIGDSVNFSARLQNLTKYYGVEILACETTAAAVADRHRLREIDLITVRGRQRSSRVYQIVPDGAYPGIDVAALLDAYGQGRERLARRDWPGARAAFEAALGCHPGDRPARLMLERTIALAGAPPDGGWDGVWREAPEGA